MNNLMQSLAVPTEHYLNVCEEVNRQLLPLIEILRREPLPDLQEQLAIRIDDRVEHVGCVNYQP